MARCRSARTGGPGRGLRAAMIGTACSTFTVAPVSVVAVDTTGLSLPSRRCRNCSRCLMILLAGWLWSRASLGDLAEPMGITREADEAFRHRSLLSAKVGPPLPKTIGMSATRGSRAQPTRGPIGSRRGVVQTNARRACRPGTPRCRGPSSPQPADAHGVEAAADPTRAVGIRLDSRMLTSRGLPFYAGPPRTGSSGALPKSGKRRHHRS